MSGELDACLEDALAIRYTHDMPEGKAFVALLEWECHIGAAVSIGKGLGMDEAAVMARYNELREAQG